MPSASVLSGEFLGARIETAQAEFRLRALNGHQNCGSGDMADQFESFEALAEVLVEGRDYQIVPFALSVSKAPHKAQSRHPCSLDTQSERDGSNADFSAVCCIRKIGTILESLPASVTALWDWEKK